MRACGCRWAWTVLAGPRNPGVETMRPRACSVLPKRPPRAGMSPRAPERRGRALFRGESRLPAAGKPSENPLQEDCWRDAVTATFGGSENSASVAGHVRHMSGSFCRLAPGSGCSGTQTQDASGTTWQISIPGRKKGNTASCCKVLRQLPYHSARGKLAPLPGLRYCEDAKTARFPTSPL